MEYYNRYTQFILNGEQSIVPFVELPSKSTDKKYIYKVGKSRMDKISQQFYNTPYFGWLILQANPQYGGTEWSIPDNAIIIVPFPLQQSLQDYKAALDTHFFYYGR